MYARLHVCLMECGFWWRLDKMILLHNITWLLYNHTYYFFYESFAAVVVEKQLIFYITSQRQQQPHILKTSTRNKRSFFLLCRSAWSPLDWMFLLTFLCSCTFLTVSSLYLLSLQISYFLREPLLVIRERYYYDIIGLQPYVCDLKVATYFTFFG